MSIRSFKNEYAQAIFLGQDPGKGFPADAIRVARRKLVMLHAAKQLSDLRRPPSNHLEALKRDRVGQHSIRISALCGPAVTRKMLRLPTITKDQA